MADDMGVWKNNRVDTGYVCVSTADGVITQVEKCGPPTNQSAQTYHSEAYLPQPWSQPFSEKANSTAVW